MPGFSVQGIGDTGRPGSVRASGRVDVYPTFAWDIRTILGSSVSKFPPIIWTREATLPTFRTTINTVEGGSLKYKFPESVEWEDINVTWYDTVGMLDIMRGWRETVWTPQSGMQTPNEYKKNTELTTFTPDGANEAVWRIVGGWPSAIKYGDLSYTTSEVRVISVQLTYDWALENASASEGTGGTMGTSISVSTLAPLVSPTPTPVLS